MNSMNKQNSEMMYIRKLNKMTVTSSASLIYVYIALIVCNCIGMGQNAKEYGNILYIPLDQYWVTFGVFTVVHCYTH